MFQRLLGEGNVEAEELEAQNQYLHLPSELHFMSLKLIIYQRVMD